VLVGSGSERKLHLNYYLKLSGAFIWLSGDLDACSVVWALLNNRLPMLITPVEPGTAEGVVGGVERVGAPADVRRVFTIDY
jgi:hypothetical protein